MKTAKEFTKQKAAEEATHFKVKVGKHEGVYKQPENGVYGGFLARLEELHGDIKRRSGKTLDLATSSAMVVLLASCHVSGVNFHTDRPLREQFAAALQVFNAVNRFFATATPVEDGKFYEVKVYPIKSGKVSPKACASVVYKDIDMEGLRMVIDKSHSPYAQAVALLNRCYEKGDRILELPGLEWAAVFSALEAVMLSPFEEEIKKK